MFGLRIAGEIVEGSKDLDFSAATEETSSEVFGGAAGAGGGGGGGGGSSNSNSSSGYNSGIVGASVGSKRAMGPSMLIKDEELGGNVLINCLCTFSDMVVFV